ncbi:tetrahydrofolate synthase [Actinomyces sp. Chiba101]|uniref:bifunctional folylpolyglutamate synthase/dihydrofolate synthase n=1 Tax=Actinomyces TaxID=1654 RepID=UPI000974E626|nr:MULTISPECIES: folylpolyglutamate synthase/dihydrofolate synthase family protein [Actinomyces]BAW93564.1 tetrahydrofolate synthase [Actinomyces sp. Chiba101]GAV93589.1 tetrahydrofolate synthase FolC [Actinomyces denticolens]SUU74523.1 Folylpolyglutamate synthase [Actinomyces denticolens]
MTHHHQGSGSAASAGGGPGSGGGAPSHPGAAFGIPAHATAEEVVDAVFGAGDGGEGIDPALLPYLEAADAPAAGAPGSAAAGLSLAEVGQARRARAEARSAAEAEDLAALRELVAHNMLASGDPDELDALLAEVDADESDDWESWEPVLPDTGGDPGEHDAHRRALLAAARGVEVSERMRQVEAEILSRAPEHRVQPSLERIEAVMDILGHPERAYRVIHITGTNGKTSTARMVERLVAAAGLRTGRFTSPHLATIRERISLDGEPIGEAGFIAAWEDVAPYIAMVDERSQADGGPRMSFFEVLTVMALAAFADHPVDAAIIEVGMGGTWDCTNVVDSDVEVITPIGLDHASWLGSTIREVARNKAGIIKDGATLITSVQVPEAQEVIADAAAARRVVWRRELDPDEDPGEPGAGELSVRSRELAVGGQLVTLATAAAVYEDVFVPLHGEYQAHNALLALAAAEAFFGGRALPPALVEEGFASTTSPGRLEVLRSSPTVIVDAGHNPHGVAALMPAIEEAFGFSHLVAVMGAMADKDVEGILSLLEPACDAVVCVPIDSPRAMDAEDLGAVAREVFGEDRVQVAQALADGVDRAVALSEGGDGPLTASGVLIVGSVVLAAEARALFRRP